jgi:hypothetical protein
MERIRKLNIYQKAIILFLAIMLLVFCVTYFVVTGREGFRYMDTILVPATQDGVTCYSGRIKGEDTVFTVDQNQNVILRWGNRIYGPYSVKEDNTAIPQEESFAEYMTGIEILEGDTVFFRGGVVKMDGDEGFWFVIREDGRNLSIDITATMTDGTVLDSDGNVVDPMEPTVYTLLELLSVPEITHKGNWSAWFGCLILSFITALLILYADEVWVFSMSMRILDADRAEPTELEIFSRYAAWTVLTVIILVIYVLGLQ